MSFPTAASPSDYRAVVALNNMGVTLLERRCHRDAMATFKDALDLMADIRPVSQKLKRLSAIERNELLQKATRCTVRSAPVSESTSPTSFDLTVLSQDNSPEAVSVALHTVPSGSSGFALLIEFDECTINLSIDTAILLHNCSVACRMQSLATKKKTKASQLLERAYKLTQVSNNILSQESDILVDELELERASIVSLLVLQDLMQLSSQRGDKDTARKYYCELGLLRAHFLATRVGLPIPSKRMIASAA